MINIVSKKTIDDIANSEYRFDEYDVFYSFATFENESSWAKDVSVLNPLKMSTQSVYGLILDENDTRFDLWYKQCLDLNKEQRDALNDIMCCVWNDYSVWIVNDYLFDDVMMNVVESLIMYIKEMYGYHINIVKDVEDIYSLKQGEFNELGIKLMDSLMYEKRVGES